MLSMLPLITGWIKAAGFNYERMQQAAQSGFTNAWAAATYLVSRGIPSRLSHKLTGKAVQICVDKGCELQDLALEDLRALSPAFDSGFYEALKLSSVLAIHDVPGGTAPARVRHALKSTAAKIQSLREEVHAHA